MSGAIAVPLNYRMQIESIIVDDEGGWKLTAASNDPDGGWTFAGVTKKIWNKSPLDFTHDEMAHVIAADIEGTKEIVYQIYYEEFVRPLLDKFNANPPRTGYISCAVNCGVETALQLIDSTNNYPQFLLAWMDHYFDLVRKNAEAWREYALQLEQHSGELSSLAADKPKTLREEYIKGWFNRVDRYRTLLNIELAVAPKS